MEDVQYYAHRAGEEREAAFAAELMSVRLLHLEFAELYEARVRELLAAQRRSTYHIVPELENRASAAAGADGLTQRAVRIA